MINWDNYRKEFPILETYAYFNTARFCALPASVIRIQKRYLEGLAENGSWNFEEWSETYEQTRENAGRLIGSNKDNIFFIPNVSTGINLSSLYLTQKKVVLLEGDFPSVTLPWTSHGFEIESVEMRTEGLYKSLEDKLSAGNKILCVSWVQSKDGFQLNLNQIFEICKKHKISLVLDGTQGLGAIPFTIDPNVSMVFLSSSFKWLLAGYGVAMGYVSDDLISKFKAFQGWNSIDFGTGMAKTGAASLEVGNALFLNVLGLNEGIKFIEEIGLQNIYERNIDYASDLISRLEAIGRPIEKSAQSGSSIIRLKVEPQEYQKLEKAMVQTSNQGEYVRLSPHFYNNETDIDRLIECLQ